MKYPVVPTLLAGLSLALTACNVGRIDPLGSVQKAAYKASSPFRSEAEPPPQDEEGVAYTPPVDRGKSGERYPTWDAKAFRERQEREKQAREKRERERQARERREREKRAREKRESKESPERASVEPSSEEDRRAPAAETTRSPAAADEEETSTSSTTDAAPSSSESRSRRRGREPAEEAPQREPAKKYEWEPVENGDLPIPPPPGEGHSSREETWQELQRKISAQQRSAAAPEPRERRSSGDRSSEQDAADDDPESSGTSGSVGEDEAATDAQAAIENESSPSGQGGGAPTRATTHDQRLVQLAKRRLSEKTADEYHIGPGDLLEINVFDLPELTRKARVSGSGYVQLPLLGAVPAEGKTESELSAYLERRLGESYLQDPETDVFILEYKSRQIAVTGAVAEPGVYPLNRGGMTLLDAISEAGGATKDSGGLVEFIPAADGRSPQAFQVASTSQMVGEGLDRRDIARSDTIRIGLNDLMRGTNQAALNLPVRAGDVIHVAEAGQFTVQGWVENPGSYEITRDSTVLAAITTAGGALFPAKTSRVQVLRSYGDTGVVREVIEVDLDAIRDGEVSDVPLEPGDVVNVDSYKTLLPAYAVYSLFKSIINVGAGIPLS